MAATENNIVTVFGGSGFVGTRAVQLLAAAGYRIRVAVRRPDLAGEVRMFGFPGQIVPIQANLRNEPSVRRAVEGASVVINLVGIGFERGKQRFRTIHAIGAKTVAQAAKDAGAETLVHMSVLGADRASPSRGARSRAEGEAGVLEVFPRAVIFRPSIMFGPGDGFFNLMGTLARLSPVLPLIGGETLFQPVFAGDVAEALLAASQGKLKGGQIYELGGPEVETHRALLKRILAQIGRSNPLIPVPAGLAKLLALPMGLAPRPLLTGDQIAQLQVDNVVSPDAIRDKRTLTGIGITPTPMDAILPSYLWRFRRNGQFDRQTA